MSDPEALEASRQAALAEAATLLWAWGWYDLAEACRAEQVEGTYRHVPQCNAGCGDDVHYLLPGEDYSASSARGSSAPTPEPS